MKVYAATHNSDQTEGRGHTVVRAYFTNYDEAVKAVKGQGVMGYGDGEVYYVELLPQVYDTFEEYKANLPKKANKEMGFNKDTLVYGYHQNWQGKWVHGPVEDAPVNDPDFKEYMRLKAKFGG